MSIRIEKIKINRYGPLTRDFVLVPGNINLVYGPNETGKTYIVESLISILFRTGKKSAVQWELRGWDVGGSINVSGLGERPVSLTRTGKKLEDYWQEEAGLPQDFSRLMVVKAGETLLAEGRDGVGRDVLKNYLSGEGLLDDIAKAIPSNIQKAELVNGDIPGPLQGDVKKRRETLIELERINKLLDDAGKAYASAELDSLRRKEQDLKEQMAKLGQAKHYYAAGIFKNREKLKLQIRALPAEEDLYKTLAGIENYEKNKSEIGRITAEVKDMAAIVDNYHWIEKALELYRDFSARAVRPPGLIVMIFIVIVLAGAGVAGYYNMTIPFLVTLAVLLILLIIYYLGMRRSASASTENAELRKLKDEYKKRFDQDLTDLAALEVRRESLKSDYYKVVTIQEELEKKVGALQADGTNLRIKVKTMTGLELAPDEWRAAVVELMERRKKLLDDISSLEEQLRALAVRQEEFVDEDPGITWDSATYNDLLEQLKSVGVALQEEERNLEGQRLRVVQETGHENGDWEELLDALEKKRESVVEEYKRITARILAGKQVYEVIQEYRKTEDERIASGLERQELTSPLIAVTRHYKNIRQDVDKGLVLTSEEESEFSLAELSTGAREQVFLALRMGFSAIATKGQPAFLILDDAFQHSDWPRRENLVDQVVKLQKSGWQIFYFTMDDHIRDLFVKAGKKLGDAFTFTELKS